MALKLIKPEIRIIGIDDTYFEKFGPGKKVLVIGAIFRAGEWLEGIVSTHVNKDGADSTEKLVDMINRSKHKEQLRVIMLNGIALAGFNVVDINALSKRTGLPVITIIRKNPDYKAINTALKHFKDGEKRMKTILKAGPVRQLNLRGKKIYYQTAGIEAELCEKVIKLSATHSLVPEPIRVAHIIGSGIVLGETKGRV